MEASTSRKYGQTTCQRPYRGLASDQTRLGQQRPEHLNDGLSAIGVVSKRRDAPYRSGACRGWRKLKTMAWREANRERWRLFETPGL